MRLVYFFLTVCSLGSTHMYHVKYKTYLLFTEPFQTVITIFVSSYSRLPKALVLNICLNIKNNYSMKEIKNRGMSCNSLRIPAFVV